MCVEEVGEGAVREAQQEPGVMSGREAVTMAENIEHIESVRGTKVICRCKMLGGKKKKEKTHFSYLMLLLC